MKDFYVSTLPLPKKEIQVTCAKCGMVLKSVVWKDYFDHKRQFAKCQAYKGVCPECGTKVKWQKTDAGYLAECENGDFLVWKADRNGYNWRYRKHGDEYPKHIHWQPTKESAMAACAKHLEWKAKK